jgi:hypothetical protein
MLAVLLIVNVCVACGPSNQGAAGAEGGAGGGPGSAAGGGSNRAGEGSGGAGGGSGASRGSESTPSPLSYKVLDSACPLKWVGLTVTTDRRAEIDYLDDMPACVDESGNRTYLENQSDAVWTIRSLSSAGRVDWFKSSLEDESFRAAVNATRPGWAILVPGTAVVVDLPPDQVEWLVDLPLSFAWPAHGVVLDKIKGAGEAVAIAALKRQSRAGGALGVCTLAVAEYAKSVSSLEDADSSDVLLAGLGVGVATSKCRAEAAGVVLGGKAGRSTALADELKGLKSQAKILEKVHVQVSWAQKAAKVLIMGLKIFK